MVFWAAISYDQYLSSTSVPFSLSSNLLTGLRAAVLYSMILASIAIQSVFDSNVPAFFWESFSNGFLTTKFSISYFSRAILLRFLRCDFGTLLF